jgi:hypothetical protein
MDLLDREPLDEVHAADLRSADRAGSEPRLTAPLDAEGGSDFNRRRLRSIQAAPTPSADSARDAALAQALKRPCRRRARVRQTQERVGATAAPDAWTRTSEVARRPYCLGEVRMRACEGASRARGGVKRPPSQAACPAVRATFESFRGTNLAPSRPPPRHRVRSNRSATGRNRRALASERRRTTPPYSPRLLPLAFTRRFAAPPSAFIRRRSWAIPADPTGRKGPLCRASADGASRTRTATSWARSKLARDVSGDRRRRPA